MEKVNLKLQHRPLNKIHGLSEKKKSNLQVATFTFTHLHFV